MTSFQTLYELAVKKKGSTSLLEEALPSVATSVELSKIPDDRYLSMMTRCVFRAGFVWLSLIHLSEPTRPERIAVARFGV